MIMKKKEYIKPSVEVIEFEFEPLMLSASNQVDVFDKETDSDASMANGRRGTWGNLWADDKEWN